MLSRPARVAIIDDHPGVRAGMVQLVELDPGLEVHCEAGDASEGLDRVDESVDVVVTDLKMPGLDGLALTRLLKRTFPALPVLVLSSFDETLYAEQAIEACASGYLMKSTDPDLLLRAIHAVRQGQLALSREMWSHMLPGEVEDRVRSTDDAALLAQLAGVPQPYRALGKSLGLTSLEVERRLLEIAAEAGFLSPAQLLLHMHRDDARF